MGEMDAGTAAPVHAGVCMRCEVWQQGGGEWGSSSCAQELRGFPGLFLSLSVPFLGAFLLVVFFFFGILLFPLLQPCFCRPGCPDTQPSLLAHWTVIGRGRSFHAWYFPRRSSRSLSHTHTPLPACLSSSEPRSCSTLPFILPNRLFINIPPLSLIFLSSII